MADLQGGKRKRPATRPEGRFPGATSGQLLLSYRQERYSRGCVGIARSAYNCMVANGQASRDANLWRTHHYLEKEFNSVRHIDPSFGLRDPDEQVRGHEAYRNYRNACSSWRCNQITVRSPAFHSRSRTGAGSLMTIPGVHHVGYDRHGRIGSPCLGSVRKTRSLPVGIPHEITDCKRNSRWYASVACLKLFIQGSPRRGTRMVSEPEPLRPARLDHGASAAEPGSSPGLLSFGLWKTDSAEIP